MWRSENRNARIDEKAPELTRVPTRQFFNKRILRLKKDFALSEFSGIILTNNEIKDI